MSAIEKFHLQLNQTLSGAMEGGAPLEELILAMDLAHDDLLRMRAVVIARGQRQKQAAAIVAAHQMPNGREITPPGGQTNR